MIPLPLLLAALGASIGAATSRKDRRKGALKGALLGGLGGLVAPALGIGAGGAGAGAATTGGGLLSQAGNITTLGGGKLGLAAGAETAVGSAAAKEGILKGFMGSELGKGMMSELGGQIAGGILGGGGQPAPTMTDVSFPGVGYTEAPIAPTLGGTSPLAYNTPDWQMQQEILRRRMMGYA